MKTKKSHLIAKTNSPVTTLCFADDEQRFIWTGTAKSSINLWNTGTHTYFTHVTHRYFFKKKNDTKPSSHSFS